MAGYNTEELIERVRGALIEAALAAYEDAGIRGLCAEGAWEVAVGAMRSVHLSALARPGSAPDAGGA
jgi:hypothetical protein